MREYRLIDADCHTLEPPHLWEHYLPAEFHDRAPKLVKDEEGGDAWSFGSGKPLMYIGLVATPGMRYEDIRWRGYTYDTIRKGCWDGKARLEDMNLDGVDAEFLYPSQRTMYHFMGNPDLDFHRAGVRAYNDWLAGEFCSNDPERLFGLAQIPNVGVDEAIREMQRCREKGFRGVILTAWPSGGDTLGLEDDRFFAAAQDLAMPISIHIRIVRPGRKSTGALEGPGAIANMALAGMTLFPEVMSEIIVSGVHDRFPKLTFLGVETDVGWIPAALEQLDNFYWRNRAHTGIQIKRLPSEYFHDHWVCTFIHDRVGIRNRYDVGVRNMAWSTDYPHHGNDWPYSRKVVGEMFDGVPARERYEICAGNMVRAYALGQAMEVPA
ncbi:MAG TPA: amidohydrolase family protein [Myxococcota bacterium]|nr:amidohydrolase family protein [Myxococcota bacterium]